MKKQFCAVIPAAGKGTRFLPFTAVIPKEMVPLMQFPAIEFIAREYETSGLTDVFFIINETKKMILEYVKSVHQKRSDNCSVHAVYQEQALGLGHAVLQAKNKVQGTYFGILLPDDIIFSKIPALLQLKLLSEKYDASVIAIKKVPENLVSSYGIVSFTKEIEKNLFELDSIVEKPDKNAAPSCYAIVGRYILHSDTFNHLATISPGAKGEYQLTDAISLLMQNKKKVLGFLFEGTHFDVGTPESWLHAVNYCAEHGVK
jgi:UTP--glucose-1-phosphate uridylyltransferase